ncbi:hypothetical protein F7731_00915 [Cytobacillus depressus]|uniref:Uncharacterized protein n=1 Tax=Cytobacillus depressus TaxID=1602942 RepID=A0A6L3VFT4_9BACI|nr:hypothetical protein [Cytobacillus depressus]KAB2338165.1 hypothetical protein F7731_00915 [Cytobacillus depressus]
MKLIVDLNEQIKKDIAKLEEECEQIGKKLQTMYKQKFNALNEQFIIELIREIKGKQATDEDIFSDRYESYLELGVEKNGMYFPNSSIPIWKCKAEMFHKVGYLMKLSIPSLEAKLKNLIIDIFEDHRRELDENDDD